VSEDTDLAVIQVWINPLVTWVWIGGLVLTLGTILTVLPNVKRRRIARSKKELDRMLRATETV